MRIFTGDLPTRYDVDHMCAWARQNGINPEDAGFPFIVDGDRATFPEDHWDPKAKNYTPTVMRTVRLTVPLPAALAIHALATA